MSNQVIFLLLVFGAVIFMSQTLFVSVYSPQRAKTRQLKKQLDQLAAVDELQVDLVLNHRLEKLPAVFKKLEQMDFFASITRKLDMGGKSLFGHQYVFIGIVFIALITPLVWLFTFDPLFVLISAIIIAIGFHLKLNRDISARLEKIEEQFPQTLDVLKRGLQAGYAFSESLKLVCDETKGELAEEFNLMFKQINYGSDVKTALLTFVHRVPTTSAMGFASAVSIQKETGGNLAEKIENIARIIRQRFKFKRRVRTLSAEGRLSGWVLILTPFVLFAVIYFSTPSYVETLISTPNGINLIKWGIFGMIIGIWWINKIIQIEV
ncbi:type II secretion system F family protein [Thalassotalea fonticola]|uniref:Type II secretion system F family protein n=1 Tax=Thalassotalea fonticola TaxID=3065649 RepID=A0ABZ0GUC5_9GAMM|nr:type II secretion system F family protein [Colwelliaceae bacterium S1-1]